MRQTIQLRLFHPYINRQYSTVLPIDENILIERLRDTKTRRAAFSDMVKIYSEPLYWHIRRMVLNHDDANDLLQNTFIKAWIGIDGFMGNAKVLTWLYRIATNETLTWLNRTPKLPSHPGFHITLSRIPCALQQVLVGYPF